MSEGEVTKEIHYHGNGSTRIVWAWAGVATAIVVAIIGGYTWKVAGALMTLTSQVASLETEVENLNRTIERYHRE